MANETKRTENVIIKEAHKITEGMGWMGSPWAMKGSSPELDALLAEAVASREDISDEEIAAMDLLESRMAEYEQEAM